MRIAVTILIAAAAVAQNPPARTQSPSAAQVDAARAAEFSAQTNSARMRESRTAMQLIDSTRSAREAIARNDTRAALDAVKRALDASREIDRKHGRPGKIPVYSEVVRISVHAPAKVGGTPPSHTGSADRTRQPIQQVAAEYTNVFLNTTSTTKHLYQARAALERNDIKSAGNALAAVQSAVTTESVGADMPLIRARENLVIAAGQVRTGDYRSAQVTLGTAVEALENYANGVNPAHEAQARVLGREIVLYAQRLLTDSNGAAAKIEDWWDRIASWTEPGAPSSR